MRKIRLKLKIIMTNLSRIIMSFLFVNLGSLFQNGVQASTDPTCYWVGPTVDKKVSDFSWDKVFIILVPIVIVITLISFIIIKRKKKKAKKKENKGE